MQSAAAWITWAWTVILNAGPGYAAIFCCTDKINENVKIFGTSTQIYLNKQILKTCSELYSLKTTCFNSGVGLPGLSWLNIKKVFAYFSLKKIMYMKFWATGPK